MDPIDVKFDKETSIPVSDSSHPQIIQTCEILRRVEKALTVNEAINLIGFGAFQGFVFIASGSVTFLIASCVMMISFLFKPLRDTGFAQNRIEESTIGAVVSAGMGFGYLLWGVLSDKYGRKIVIEVTCFSIAVGGTLSCITPNIWCLYPCLFLVGIGCGGGAVPINLFCEYLPDRTRGFFLTCTQMYWTAGCIYSSFVAWIVLPEEESSRYWRLYILICVCPVVFIFLSLSVLPESIRYLSVCGSEEKVRKILKRMQSVNCRALEKGTTVVVSGKVEEEEEHFIEGEVGGGAPENEKKKSAGKAGKLGDLCRRGVMLRLLNIAFWWSLSTFVYFGLIESTPDLFSRGGGSAYFWGTIVSSVAEIPGILYSSFFVNCQGRIGVMVCSLFVVGVGMMILGIPQLDEVKWLWLRILVVFVCRGAVMAATATAWLAAAESLPSNIRGTGVGIASFVSRSGAIVSPYVAKMFGREHETIPIFIYAGASFIACIFGWMHPETMGQELVDVEKVEDEEDEADIEGVIIEEDVGYGGLSLQNERGGGDVSVFSGV